GGARLDAARRSRSAAERATSGDPAVPAPASPSELDKACRELRPLALVLVLEEHERLFPRLLAHALRPGGELGITVIRTAQPQIAPRRGGDLRRLAFLGVGQAQRRALGPQRFVDL